MKLENLVFDFDRFASEMAALKDKKHFDYLVTIIGEDFGADEGLGCILPAHKFVVMVLHLTVQERRMGN